MKDFLLKAKEKILPVFKKKITWAVLGALLVLIILISIISSAAKSNNGFVNQKNVVTPIPVDDEINVLVDSKLLSKKISGTADDSSSSIEGSVCALTNEDGELYIINGKKITKAAEEVVSFKVSVDGSGVVYAQKSDDGYKLVLYNVKSGKSTTVCEEADSSYKIAPDGKTMCYYVTDDDGTSTLYLFNGKKSIKITSAEVEVAAISKGGKFIYAVSTNDEGEKYLNTYSQKGEKTKLGKISGSSVYLNYDHTQIMYFNEGKTFISTNGKAGVKYSSVQLSMVGINTASGKYDSSKGPSEYTYPVKSLFDHIYRGSNDGKVALYHIKKNPDKTVKLVSNVSSVRLDKSASFIYYTNDDGDLKVIKISDGEKASERAKKLAEEVEYFEVTPNRKLVYYVSDDTLYSTNARKAGKSRTIADEVDDLVISCKNVAYYIYEDSLYACSNGRKGKMVLSDVDFVSGINNGYVVAGDDDNYYITTGALKLKKLLSR